jgi:hypothetical protein
MRLELGPGSGRRNVDGLYTEERGVEGRRDLSSSCFDAEVAVELRTDLASRMVLTVDTDGD